MSIYKGMLEASIITVDENGESITPYFDKEILGNYVETYLEDNIKRFSNHYTVNIAYPDDLEKSREVSISLDAYINYLFHYQKTRTFNVLSRDEL